MRLARNMMNARPSRLQFVDGEKVLVHPTSESDSVQHAVDEGDLEAVTAWMASKNVNDTVLKCNASYDCTLLKLIASRATNAKAMQILAKRGARQVSVLPLARAVIARGADVDLSKAGWAPLHYAAQSRGYEPVAM